MEAAAVTWENDLLAAQRPYVERQLGAGVAKATVVRDLVGMGADPNVAAAFVGKAAKSVAPIVWRGVAVDAVRLRVYLLWAGVGALFGVVAGGLLVVGAGLAVTHASVGAGVPPLASIARIEAASLLPGVLVGVLLRRQLSPSLRWRSATAAAAALVAILAVRLLTVVEVLHESAGTGRTALLTSGTVLERFATAPTDVYATWSSPRVAPLVLWDVAFVGLAAFVAAVFSRHPQEQR
jgi:hypothetical protein